MDSSIEQLTFGFSAVRHAIFIGYGYRNNQIAGVKSGAFSLPRSRNRRIPLNSRRLTALDELPDPVLSGPSLLSVGIVSGKAAVVKLLTRLETDGFSGRDCDLFTGTRVATNSTLARFDNKDAEAAQFDPVTAGQGVLHGIEECLNCLLRLEFRYSGF